MNTLIVKNLRKSFQYKETRIVAADGISFTVRQGEIFGLLGVNGAGKSTIINMLTGLMAPDSGSIVMFGKDFARHEEECKSKFNIATAYHNLDRNLTARENLYVYAHLYNVKNYQKKIHDLATIFMLTHRLDTKVRSLSSGENSRLVLIKGLLNDPQLLFLDECTVGLDPDMAQVTRQYLTQYNKETGCTIVFTSHYMQEVEQLCHRIAFVDTGKIVKIGKAQDLIQELKTQIVEIHLNNIHHLEKAEQILHNQRAQIVERRKNVLSFSVKNEKKILYALLEKLIEAKITFDDLHLYKPTLEDYFIHTSRRQKK